jgi:hydrogenase maturation protease
MRYLVGFGNYTASDDGIGVRLVEAIAERGLDVGFRALDLATDSLDLLAYLRRDTEAVLIIDSARMGEPAGAVRFFAPSEVGGRPAQGGLSTHEGDVLQVLDLAASLGYPIPRILIMGIEPATVEPGLELSPALERRFEEYLQAALAKVVSI